MALNETNTKGANVELHYIRIAPSETADNEEPLPPTLIFLHGSESCHLEFSRVVTFLPKTYDNILVDLPGHSGSKDIPFSFDNIINPLIHIITTQVKGGRVHIVGLSAGGYIGLEFARRRPDLILSLWCTGSAPFSGFRLWIQSKPRLLAGVVSLASRFATEKMFWSSLGVEPMPGLREEAQKNQRNTAAMTAIFDATTKVNMESLAEIKDVRIAMIAAGKGDNVEDTVQAGKLLRSKNPQCNAFAVRDAIHWWSLQYPELFAQGVKAWIEGTDMPKQYEPLLTDS